MPRSQATAEALLRRYTLRVRSWERPSRDEYHPEPIIKKRESDIFARRAPSSERHGAVRPDTAIAAGILEFLVVPTGCSDKAREHRARRRAVVN
jgi:hypothetical protein